jgi:hypothetical protein
MNLPIDFIDRLASLKKDGVVSAVDAADKNK